MATNTMDAIKKKMQVMRNERDTALDKGDQLEQKVSEQKAINEKVGTRTRLLFFHRQFRKYCAYSLHTSAL